MGAFLSLLSGVASGATERAQEDRARQERMNKLQADSMLKMLSDPDMVSQMSPEDMEAGYKQVFKASGMSDKDAQAVLGHMRQLHGAHKAAGAPEGLSPFDEATGGVPGTSAPPRPWRKAGEAPEPPAAPAPATAGAAPPSLGAVPEAPPTAAPAGKGLGAMPTQKPTPELPPMPPFIPPISNPQTYGDINMNKAAHLEHIKSVNEINRRFVEENAKQDAILKREKAMADDEFDKFLQVKAKAAETGGHVKAEYIGGHLRAVPDSGTFSGNVMGRDVPEVEPGRSEEIPEAWKNKLLRRKTYEGGSVVKYEPVTQAAMLPTVSQTVQTTEGSVTTRYKAGVGQPPSLAPTGVAPAAGKYDFGVSSIPGQTPASKTTGKTPPIVAPYNPADKIDYLLASVGQDAANEKLLVKLKGKDYTYALQRMADLGIQPNNISASVRDAAQRAKAVLPHYDEILANIDKIGDRLGIVASRWNEFMAGKIGAGELGTAGTDFVTLRNDISLIKSNLAQVHGGARAAGSIQMLERFDKIINAGTMDAPTLKASVLAAKKWIQGYADMIPTREAVVAKMPGGAAAAAPGVTAKSGPLGAVPTQRRPLSEIFGSK